MDKGIYFSWGNSFPVLLYYSYVPSKVNLNLITSMSKNFCRCAMLLRITRDSTHSHNLHALKLRFQILHTSLISTVGYGSTCSRAKGRGPRPALVRAREAGRRCGRLPRADHAWHHQVLRPVWDMVHPRLVLSHVLFNHILSTITFHYVTSCICTFRSLSILVYSNIFIYTRI